ncbi:hypothetical protein [Actinomadura bangladeshensis]|uniref:Uncharacterized protein n=1 Tax=Actinomadura bangladeshensis TaxID=453573 RepID=A0A4R4NT72_9ACTN|nr:hypothetical protein [Actinomadura bangladeshensis]TDC12589.1 hypothetical protein E1284_23005 [Actinomadura bangladeshensis]
MHPNGQQVVFAAPRKAWRWIAAGLFLVSVVLLVVVLAASPDLGSGFGRALFILLMESVFTRRTEGGELLLCVRPAEAAAFIARAPSERQDGMRSNLETYEAPLFINVSAFWQETADELAAAITRLTAGRLSLAAGG